MNTSVSVSFDRARTVLSTGFGLGVAFSMFCSVAQGGNPNPEWDDQWTSKESVFLTGHHQITFEDDFLKAGESYFSDDGSRIIFQGIPMPEVGEEALAHYLMYVEIGRAHV